MRINPDTYYVDGVQLPQAYWRALDLAQSQSWNGDLGTSHNPTSAIVIGGAGVWIAGPCTYAGISGAGIYNAPGSGSRIVLGDNDWIQFQPSAANGSRGLLTSLGRAHDCSYVPAIVPGSTPSIARFGYVAAVDGIINICPGGVGISAGASVSTDAYPPYGGGGRLCVPLRVHHNATLQSVTLYFAVTTNRVAVPWSATTSYVRNQIVKPTSAAGWFRAVVAGTSGGSEPSWNTVLRQTTSDLGTASFGWICMGTTSVGPASTLPGVQPRFRVIAVDGSGNVTPLQTSTTDPTGFVALQAASSSAYYNSGNPQSILYTCDLGVIIDTTRFNYFVQVMDESDVPGGNALPGNKYISALAQFINIPDLQPG